MKMKRWYLFLFAGLLCFALASCDKDDDPTLDNPPVDYTPGEIPGLGGADGELTGAPFKLPDGVELIDNITGDGSQRGYWDFSGSYAPNATFTQKDGSVVTRALGVQTRAGETRHYYGSGKGYVDLLIPMRNGRSGPITVTFPAGTILRSQNANRQHGVLIKKVAVTIPANSDYYLCLAFYCGNAHKGSAGSNDVYELGVVTNARPLLDLCDRVKNKKINIEDFSRTSYGDYGIYNSQIGRLQSIVWEITDEEGLSEEDIAYINALPNV